MHLAGYDWLLTLDQDTHLPPETFQLLGPLRLASILQLSVRWYVIAAVLMAFLMIAGGSQFFAMKHLSGGEAMWRLPLRITAISCCTTFAISPMLSFLEGCGQVTEVSKMRFVQSLFATALAWAAMFSHHGLYAPALVLSSQALVAFALSFANAASCSSCCGYAGRKQSTGDARYGRFSGRSPSVGSAITLSFSFLRRSCLPSAALSRQNAWVLHERGAAVERDGAGLDEQYSRLAIAPLILHRRL